jgi:hypothetical protein
MNSPVNTPIHRFTAVLTKLIEEFHSGFLP